MADYREISQGYAKGAISAAMVINAGAAVALLSQIGQMIEHKLIDVAQPSMVAWAIGIGLAAFAWITGFASTRYVDKSEREQALASDHLKTADRWMLLGVLLVAASIGAFLYGCVKLACGIPIIV